MSEYKVTCNLCQKVFSAPPIEPVEAGKPPSQLAVKIIDRVVEHLQKEHTAKLIGELAPMETMILAAKEFLSWLALRNYAIEDPNLIARREALRIDAHNLTRGIMVSDEAIATKVRETVAQIPKGKITDVVAVGLMLDLRDALTQQGRYAQAAPAVAAEAPVS